VKNLVILQGILPFYRKPFFNELCKLYKTTIVHSGSQQRDDTDLFMEKIFPVNTLRNLKWQIGLFQYLNTIKPDIIIAGDDLKYINWILIRYLSPRNIIWSWWGVDDNKNKLLSKLKVKYLFPSTDNFLFYDQHTMNKIQNYGIKHDRLFLANNTIHVEQKDFIKNFDNRFSFLNVGSLDVRKQNDILIRCFSKLVNTKGKHLKLYLIGNGTQKDYLISLIDKYSMGCNIFLVGKLESQDDLKNYYDLSLASVSFGQAGLAILQSMAFGVPFLTKKNAITGGEISNIKNGINGILCEDSEKSLFESLVWCVDNPQKCQEMGLNSYEYYKANATIYGMVEAFKNAIEK